MWQPLTSVSLALRSLRVCITIKDFPKELLGQLKREAEANFRSLNQEILARIERTLEIDAALTTRRDQKWIEEAKAGGPATPLTEKEMDAIARRANLIVLKTNT